MRRAFGTLGAVALAVGVAAPASAHDYVVGSTPAADSTIKEAPKEVKLTFSDAVLTEPARPEIVVTDAAGKHFETGCAQAVDRDVTVPWQVGKPGKYTVTWRVVSSDGHPVSKQMTFTYAGTAGSNPGADKAVCVDGKAAAGAAGASANSAAAAASSPAAAGAQTSADAAAPTSSSDSDSGTSSAAVYVAVGLGVAALAVIAALVLRRPRS